MPSNIREGRLLLLGVHRGARCGEGRLAEVDYAGAVHAFSEKHAGDDPSKGAAYDAKADRRSWEAMKAFFVEVFG